MKTEKKKFKNMWISDEIREVIFQKLIAARPKEAKPLYFFTYGALMWNGKIKCESVWGVLEGYQRDVCIASVSARGSEEYPGTTFALKEGKQCEGKLFSLNPRTEIEDLKKLIFMELRSDHYIPRWETVTLNSNKQKVYAVALIANKKHNRYIGDLPFDIKVQYTATGIGKFGSANEYLNNAIDAMKSVGLEDQILIEYQKAVNLYH